MMTITGDRQVDIAFANLEPALQKKLQRKAVRASAKIVQPEIKNRAPKDRGDYAETIKVRALKRSRKNKHIVGARVVSDEKALQQIAEQEGQIFNPHWLEYGTTDNFKHPHYRPGMEAAAPAVIGEYQSTMGVLVAQATAEARRG